MKTLILIFTLSLTVGAFASENLALSECTKGNDLGRQIVVSQDGSDVSSSVSTGTNGN